LRKISTKIAAFILITTLILACNAEKRVPDGKQLLVKNQITVNGKATKEENVFNQLYQKPNSTLLLGFRLLTLPLTQLTKPNLLIIRENMKENQNGYQQSK
jgi:hypothetical protein